MREVGSACMGCGVPRSVGGGEQRDSGQHWIDPGLYTHPWWSATLRCVVPREGFAFARVSDDLAWVMGHTGSWYEVTAMGQEGAQDNMAILNRKVRWMYWGVGAKCGLEARRGNRERHGPREGLAQLRRRWGRGRRREDERRRRQAV